MFKSSMLPWIIKDIIRNRARTAAQFLIISASAFALIFFLGVKAGVHSRMIKNVTSFYHGWIQINSSVDLKRNPNGINADDVNRIISILPDNVSCSSRLRAGALVELSHVNDNFPVAVIGLDYTKEKSTTRLLDNIVDGGFPKQGSNGVLLGKSLAERLSLKSGSTLSIMLQTFDDFTGVTLEVTGVFKAGVSGFDRRNLIMELNGLQKITGFRNATEMVINKKASKIALRQQNKILHNLEDLKLKYPVTTWREIMPDVDRLIQLNHFSLDVVAVILGLLVFLGYAGILIMNFKDQVRGLSFLLALGISGKRLQHYLLYHSLVMGVVSILTGTAAGALLVMYSGWHGLDFSQFLEHNPYFMMDMVIQPEIDFSGGLFAFFGFLTAVVLAGGIFSFFIRAVSPGEAMREFS
jgi:ABC-type lipoprotein release transport system permease subunit